MSNKTLVSLEEIRNLVLALGKKINAPKNLTVIFASSPENGDPHIEIHDEEFYFICSERGNLLFEMKTKEIEELLYWIFQSITFQMAQEYEFKHRHPDRDFRRLLFSKQLELLGILSPKWEHMRKSELDVILKRNPFNDKEQ